MHLPRTGCATRPSASPRVQTRLAPTLLLCLLLPVVASTTALAAGKVKPTPPGPPMNSVSGLTRYIAVLKTKAHLREAAEEKKEAAEARADKAQGRTHAVKHDRDSDRDRDRDGDREARRDRDEDRDRDADAPRLKTVAAVKATPKAGAKPTGHARPSAAKPRKGQKPGEEDEDEDGTDYLESYLYYIQQRAFPNDSVDWSAYTAAMAQRDQMDAAPFAGPVPGHVHPNTPANYEKWEFIGPRNLAVPYRTYYGNQVLSGRVNDMAFDTTNPGTYYLASASGGAWKSVDSGASWTPLSDTWAAMQCSTVTLDPTNTQIVYIGTGDYDGANGAGGFGVMKSTDGGLTWTQYGTEFGLGRVSALVVDPNNTNILVATTGARSGVGYSADHVWRSTNAGQTWTAVASAGTSNWSDVVIGAPNVNGQRYYFACASSGNRDLFVRSADRGATWTSLTPPNTNPDGLPRVAVSQTDPNTVYFGSTNDQKIYKSVNAGATFADTTNNLPGGYNWSQASYYDFRLTSATFTDASGNAAEAVYASLIDLDQSVNGGGAWQSLGLTYTGSAILHNDQHALTINPLNPNDVLVGCDGGAFHLTYQPSNNTWSFATLNGMLGTTLFYHGAWSATDPTIMLGGTQDNATPQSGGNLNQWNNRGGGDGGFALIDQTNQNNQYTTSQNLFIYHTTNGWASQDNPTPSQRTTGGNFNGEPTAFIAPIALDPSNTHLMYAGTDHLWRYHDQTQTWDADLGGQVLARSGYTLSWIAVAPSDSNRIYTGSSYGEVWMSTDAGATWTQINSGTPALPNRYITTIDVNPTNPSDILVGLSGTGSGHLYRCVDTTAATRIWANLSGTGVNSLPNVSLNSVTRDIDDNQATFYAATDIGVFYTSDGGVTWTNATAPLGLPNVQVNQIQAVPGTRFLNVATFGRGMWRIQLPSVVNPTVAITSLSPNTASAGAAGFTLTVTGTGFIAGSTVNWNNQTRVTQFVSATTLTATIPASDVVTAGTDYVTVSNSPTVVSNALDFTVSSNGPVTTATVAGPAGTNGWYQGAVTVTLTATSPGGAGNIAATYYTVDGGTRQTYTAPFPVSGDGIHTLTFYSVDNQANEEIPHKAATVKIDGVAPSLAFGSASPASNAAGWNNAAVSVPYTTSDATSGVATAVPGSPAQVASEGRNQTQTVVVTDVAGNSARATTAAFNIDLTAPTTTGTEADTTAGATYTLSPTDALSGVAATYYTVDGNQNTYTGPFTVAAVGSHTVTFWSVDVAGNVEAAHTLATAVNPAPYLGAIAPSTVQAGGPDLTLKATGSGFLSTSVVAWNGAPLATTYVSPTELDAVVPAADTAAVGKPSVTVVTPSPGGGVSNALTFTVTDAHIPVTTATLDGPGANGRYRGDVTVTLTATDADGNLAGTFYALDAAGTKTYTAPIRITGVGSHTLTYWSTDTSGNEEIHHTLTLVIDTAGPATTLTLGGQAVSNGWYKGTVTATLAATDPDGAADVAATYYTLDGGAQQTYTAPVAITGDGPHTLTYWSVDQAGNEETPHKTATVKIDSVAPSLAFGSASPAPNAAGWNNAAVSVPYTTSDATSGVATAVPGSPVKFSAEGRNQTQSVTVTDVAGNGASFTTPTAVNIDLTAPTTTGVLGNGQLTLSAADSLSGVAATYYTLDGGPAQTYATPVTLGAGGHTVTFWSADVAGNTEGAHTLSTTTGPTGPAVLHVFPTGVQMFSVPRDLSAAPTAMDYVPSPLFVWSPALTQYVMSAGGTASSLSPGGAYWGRFKQAGTLYDMGKKTDTSKPFSVPLKAGWNMVGTPFEDGVAVKTLVILDSAGVSHDFADAAAQGLVSYNLYSYPAGSSAYTVLTAPGGTLDPYLGYWVHATKDVTLLIPPPTNRVPL